MSLPRGYTVGLGEALPCPYIIDFGQMSFFWHLTLIFLKKYSIITQGAIIQAVRRFFQWKK